MTPPVTQPDHQTGSLGKALVSSLVSLGVAAFVGAVLTTILTIGIWPGEAKLTAPLFCPDDKTDAFVVVDSYSPRPGETTYNFSLYCMGPRGEVEEIGFLLPFVVLSVVHTVLVVVLFGLIRPVKRIRRLAGRASRRSNVITADARRGRRRSNVTTADD